MTRKILELLRMLSLDRKEIEIEIVPEDIFEAIDYEDPDIEQISEELREIEGSQRFSEHELDILKAVLVYILMREGSYDKEDVFSLIFGDSRRIAWH